MRSSSRSPDPSPAERLDSWKEIAAYLRRDVRTVQRWEERRGLPVHRLGPGERAAVYAFREELDLWWNGNESTLSSRSERPRRVFRHAAVAGLTLILFGWLAYLRNGGDGERPSSPAVLVVFENEAAGGDLPAAFRTAIQQELIASGRIEVASRERVVRCLRRMRLAEGEEVDLRVGSEVALRDGNIPVIVAGRAGEMGTSLLLTVELISVARGTVVASKTRELTHDEAPWSSLRELGAWAHQELARVLPDVPPGPKLEAATTRSLDALELYSEAVALGNRGEWGGAEQLTRRALSLDPEFAAAHSWLGWALHNQGFDDSLPFFSRAVSLSIGVTEGERYFISGSYHHLAGEIDRAIADYEALLQIEPLHYWGANNLAYNYVDQGMHTKAAEILARLADANPQDFRLQARAAEGQLVWKGEATGAEPYLRRARAILAEEVPPTDPLTASWVEMAPVFLDWSAGRVPDALAKTDEMAATIPYRGTGERRFYARAVGLSYLTLGRLDDAEALFEQQPSREWRYLDLSMAALVRGDDEALKRRGRLYAENFTGWGVPLGGQLLVRAGLLEEAGRVLEYARSERFQTWKVNLLEAELALARKDVSDRTLLLLEEAVAISRVSGTASYFLAAESLAVAFIVRGELDHAIAPLEASSEERHRSYPISVNSGGFSGSLWLRNRAMLAELYRRAGRHRDADRIASSLRGDLSFADSGMRLVESASYRDTESPADSR
jgi:tetratricopeptide (TPR) repeat protein